MKKRLGLWLRIKIAMMRLVMRMMPSCREVGHLSSLAMDERLGWRTRLRVRMHVSMCEFCRRNEEQFRAIRELVHNRTAEDTVAGGNTTHLPAERRDQIRRAMREQGKQ